MNDNENIHEYTNTAWQIVSRLVASAVILAITAFFTPGFQIVNIGSLILAVAVLTLVDFFIAQITGLEASPFGKGFLGFVLSAVTLYIVQFFVAGYTISWISAIIGALIYGIVDYFIPGNQQM